LAAPELSQRLQQQILADAATKIHRDTLLVPDPTDIRKPYAQAMPHLATAAAASWCAATGRVWRWRANSPAGGCCR